MRNSGQIDFPPPSRRRFLKDAAAVGIASTVALLSRVSITEAAVCPPAAPQGPIAELNTLEQVRRAGRALGGTAIKGVDLSALDADYWRAAEIDRTYFLGCRFASTEIEAMLQQRGAVIFPRFENLPYDPYRTSLYTREELSRELASGVTIDEAIYCDYLAKGAQSAGIIEALTRRIYDDSMDDALQSYLKKAGGDKVVGIMGARETSRADPWYRRTAETARLLARAGKLVMSGGGGGMMEAANLGAYLSSYDDSALDQALEILGKAPGREATEWRSRALEVGSRFPRGADSLGVSTWFYGREPTNQFAGHIAKYFDNGTREWNLIHISTAGIVFAPGSAGTREEIFIGAEQSHHAAPGFRNVMVFLGKQQYEVYAPIFSVLREFANAKDVLFITDSPAQAAEFIVKRAAP